MLAQRWANVGVQPLGQRWANWQIHVGPTLVSRRWPNVRVDVGPTLGQRRNASWVSITQNHYLVRIVSVTQVTRVSAGLCIVMQHGKDLGLLVSVFSVITAHSGHEHWFSYLAYEYWMETTTRLHLKLINVFRDYFVNGPSQWETTLHCNIVSHWLGAYTKWSLCFHQ